MNKHIINAGRIVYLSMFAIVGILVLQDRTSSVGLLIASAGTLIVVIEGWAKSAQKA